MVKGHEIEVPEAYFYGEETTLKDEVLSCMYLKQSGNEDIIEIMGFNEKVVTMAEEIINKL